MATETPLDAPPRPPQILLVDDHADSAELLRMLLVRRGFAVTTARSVSAALAAAAAAPVDVLVSDIGLPDGDGCELLRQLRHLHVAGTLPAIAVSGSDRPADIAHAREAGFDEFLGKPVGINQLVDALQRVCSPPGAA